MSRQWAEAVRAACQPIFDAADCGFESNDGGFADALLWEADPIEFAARYPDSGIEESYGDTWPAPCIDYWIYVDANKQHARLSIEGWDEHEIEVPLTGDGPGDGLAIAREFARILRVAAPND